MTKETQNNYKETYNIMWLQRDITNHKETKNDNKLKKTNTATKTKKNNYNETQNN